MGEVHRGEGEDDGESGENEAKSPENRSHASAQTPRAVDGQLRRGWPGQEIRGGDGVFKLAGVHPLVLIDAELSKERDVRRRPSKTEAPEARPLANDDQKTDATCRYRRHVKNFGTPPRAAS
jgi:hypothetical protein